MSYDGATFAQHSVLSPPLLASIDSQHIFGSYDAPSSSSSSRHATETSSASHDQPPTTSHHRRVRSRASSGTSMQNIVANANTAISSLQQQHQNGHSNGHRRTRRGQHAPTVHSRSSSRSGPIPTPGRSATSNVGSPSAAADDLRPLTSTLRNRSTPHLDGLRSRTEEQQLLQHRHRLVFPQQHRWD